MFGNPLAQFLPSVAYFPSLVLRHFNVILYFWLLRQTQISVGCCRCLFLLT